VIKAHALIEATVTHRLTEDVDARLRRVFERLELSNTEHGKLVFAESLGSVGAKERRFIRMFSELRNKLVHDIKRVSFTFASYLEALDKNQRASFVDILSAFFDPMDKEDSRNVVLAQPRLAMWSVTMQVLALTLGESQRVKALAMFREVSPSDLGRPQ
jgi:hypothetical protein